MEELIMINDYCNCPICKSYATRIRRRFLDRVTGIFNPSYRYRCLNFHCHWQGNIRQQSHTQNSNQQHNTHA
jgi:hypothetical protein